MLSRGCGRKRGKAKGRKGEREERQKGERAKSVSLVNADH